MAYWTRLFIILAFCFVSGSVWAGGAIKTNIDGLPFHWDGEVVYNPESGVLKEGVLEEAETLDIIADAFATWTSVPGADLIATQGEFLPDGGDTTQFNFLQFFNNGAFNCYDGDPDTPCHSAMLFDEDGGMIEELFGECSQFTILGFAGFQDISGESSDPEYTIIKRGQAIFSGACIKPVEQKEGCGGCAQYLDESAVRTMITHEIGHMLGMDHSQVNPGSYQECRNSIKCPADAADQIPTMFPLLVNGANQHILHRDDEAYFLKLYGEPENDYCTVTGTVYAANGTTELRGAEVVARNISSHLEFEDAISFVSGAEAPRLTAKGKDQNNCVEDCGKYEITGLTPGETYQICVQKILSRFSGSSMINPVDPAYQGFDDDCPEGLTVTCECTGPTCSTYEGLDIVTTATGVDSSSSLSPNSGSGGGCQLGQGAARGVPYLWAWLMVLACLHALKIKSK